MDLEDTHAAAIGFHTQLSETSQHNLHKLASDGGLSCSLTTFTQSSRTVSKHFSTPQKRLENTFISRRNHGYISYARKLEQLEAKKEKPSTLPPVTKKIKKRLDLTKAKSSLESYRSNKPVKKNSMYAKSAAETSLSFSEKIMLYDWILQSCEGLKLGRSVFHLTISLIEKVTFFNKGNAQLVATSCLYMQSLLDTQSSRPIEHFEEITHGWIKASAIDAHQLLILKDQDWKLPRIPMTDSVHQYLTKWDQFVLENPKLILPEKADKCSFTQGLYSIQNYVQVMAIIDSLRVAGIANEHNIDLIVTGIITVLIGLELNYSCYQTMIPTTLDNKLYFDIVKIFLKDKFGSNTKLTSPSIGTTVLNVIKKTKEFILTVMGILVCNTDSVKEEVDAVRSGLKPKFDFDRQFYFQGIIPK